MRQWFLAATGADLFTIMVIFNLAEGATMPQLATIKGTVSYRERVAIRPGCI